MRVYKIMSSKIRVPRLPESVSDATIAIWIKQVGDNVEQEEVLLELETDKVILEVTAPASGVLTEIIEPQNAIVHSGDVIGMIEIASRVEVSPSSVSSQLKTEALVTESGEHIMPESIVQEANTQVVEDALKIKAMREDAIVESLQEPSVNAVLGMPAEQGSHPAQTDIRREILQELEQIQDEVPIEKSSQDRLTETTHRDFSNKKKTIQHQEEAPLENNNLAEVVPEQIEIERDARADDDSPFASPSVRKAMAEYDLQAQHIDGSGKQGKILKDDIAQHLQQLEPLDNVLKEPSMPDSLRVSTSPEEFVDTKNQLTDVEIATPPESSPEPIVEEQKITLFQQNVLDTQHQLPDTEIVTSPESNPELIVEAQTIATSQPQHFVGAQSQLSDADLAMPSEPVVEEQQIAPSQQQPNVVSEDAMNAKVETETEGGNTMEENNERDSTTQQQVTDLPVTTQHDQLVNTTHSATAQPVDNPLERRVPMTRLRVRIAERLVEAQQTAAILTTFNDVDLSEIIRLRKIYRDRFAQVHGIKLGFMSFFVKAATEALKRYPEVNARIDAKDIIYQGHYDIGVAVSTERGLVVPVVRDTNTLGHAEIEKKIHDYAHRARNNQLELEELIGGTFSITNGGVFGSMLSTPIINPPQSAILGMHKIEDRPVALNGEVVIRPMMYLALSYDHRLIDGKTAVSFLVKIKELLEDPASLFLEL